MTPARDRQKSLDLSDVLYSDGPQPEIGLSTLLSEVERAELERDVVDEEPTPSALTDQHAAALERAIRAEGYTILVDPETGDVKLERVTE